MTIPEHYPYRSAAAKAEYLAFYQRSAARWPADSPSRMVPTSFGQTFVRIHGPDGAPPLVLLPGITTSSLFWSANIRAFSQRYRCFALDRIGDVGLSVCTRPFTGRGDLVRWLDEVFTGLGLGSGVHLLGMSYGAWLAAQYALAFPDRLGKMVLLAPGATVLRTSWQVFARGALAFTRRRCFVRSFAAWLLADLARQDLARQDPSRVERRVDSMLRTFRCIQPRIIGPTLLTNQELGSLRMPTLFLVGEHEKIYSAAKAVRRLHRVAPRIQAEIVPNAGHDLTIAQPDVVHRKVLAFLEAPNRQPA